MSVAIKSGRESRPSAIDVHVGARVRLQRTLLGMSQERLSDALHLTFQQVQKYETGMNRISASRLFDISRILGTPIRYFFDGLPADMDSTAAPGPHSRIYGFAEAQENFSVSINGYLTKHEGTELIRVYYRITNPAVRQQVLGLMKSLAPEELPLET